MPGFKLRHFIYDLQNERISRGTFIHAISTLLIFSFDLFTLDSVNSYFLTVLLKIYKIPPSITLVLGAKHELHGIRAKMKYFYELLFLTSIHF